MTIFQHFVKNLKENFIVDYLINQLIVFLKLFMTKNKVDLVNNCQQKRSQNILNNLIHLILLIY